MDENKNLNNQPEKEEGKKKCGFLVQWYKLSKGVKIGISVAAGIALTSAIVFPTLAATVWKEKSEDPIIEITINTIIESTKTYFASDQVNFIKGKKYTFTKNLVEHTEIDGPLIIYLLDASLLNPLTNTYMLDLSIKSNKNVFNEIINPTSSIAKYQFAYDNECDFYYTGSESFNKIDESTVTCTFIAKDNGAARVCLDFAV